MRPQSKISNPLQSRQNASYTVGIGLRFSSDWLRWWREISEPIKERSNARPKQYRIIFDTQLKTALSKTEGIKTEDFPLGSRGKVPLHHLGSGRS